jgi:hypothetical protein
MNKVRDEMRKLYHKAVDLQLLNFQLESDCAIWREFFAYAEFSILFCPFLTS